VHGHTNILRFPRAYGTDRQHNAAKPVALLREILEASTDHGGRVLDLFGGSGSTLIACEQSGRSCWTMELEPKWCDVIVDRWEALTGQRAELEP
jgi:site-specific DNA-methyltransferase (adenine-specific)